MIRTQHCTRLTTTHAETSHHKPASTPIPPRIDPRTFASHVLTCVTMPPQHDKCKQKVHRFITVEEGGTNYTTENYDSVFCPF